MYNHFTGWNMFFAIFPVFPGFCSIVMQKQRKMWWKHTKLGGKCLGRCVMLLFFKEDNMHQTISIMLNAGIFHRVLNQHLSVYQCCALAFCLHFWHLFAFVWCKKSYNFFFFFFFFFLPPGFDPRTSWAASQSADHYAMPLPNHTTCLKIYFYLQNSCAAAVCWLKYTTGVSLVLRRKIILK